MKLSKANSDQSQQPISHEPLPDKSEGAHHRGCSAEDEETSLNFSDTIMRFYSV